jgi:hypothetical protein
MGASAWRYIVAFQPNIQAALDALRQEEFAAWKQAHPRKRYRSIDALLKDVGADGTSSILDVNQISATPLPATKHNFSHYNFHNPQDMAHFVAAMNEHIGKVFPLSSEDYLALFGTIRPTRHTIEQAASSLHTLYERIERDSGIYVVLYEDDVPTEIYFMGISGD